jgi:hypothetical protein
MNGTISVLREEIQRLREALEKYADITNWVQRPGCFDNDLWIMSEDGYKSARAALDPKP